MPTQVIAARVMNLNQTEAQWLIDDPVLLPGEVAYVWFGDLVNMKLGKGVKFSETQYNFSFGNGNGGGSGSIPTGQVSRYKSFIAAQVEISIKGLFNKKNSLSAIHLYKKSALNFDIKIGTSSGGSQLGTFSLINPTTPIILDELFHIDTDIYISGFTAANVCDVVVKYDSFQVNSDGSVPTDVIQDLRDAMNAMREDFLVRLAALQSSMMTIPKGIVVPWPGPIDQIPQGWSLYTGYRDKFLIGAGGKYKLNDSGGKESIKLLIENLPKFRVKFKGPKGDGSATGNKDSHPDGPLQDQYSDYIGGDVPFENLPPYIATNYIIKD